MAGRIGRDELRQLIREALREALGEARPPRSGGGGPAPGSGLRPARGQAAAVEGANAGRIARDRPLHHAAHGPPPPSRATGEEPACRLASGVLTEALVTRIARGHQRIIIGAEVAVTPLARDRARVLKIEIVRQKP